MELGTMDGVGSTATVEIGNDGGSGTPLKDGGDGDTGRLTRSGSGSGNPVGGATSAGEIVAAPDVSPGGKDHDIDRKYIIKPKDLVKGAKIGEGGYGFVYRGEWRDMEVAIKEVRGTEPEVVDMLMLEARAAIDLRPHENIVTLYGVCLEPFSIVTAFCSKGSLDNLLYGDTPVKFSDDEVQSMCVGIGTGVSHLHHEGIIHRDLAARNILVNQHGTPMVADFGMSRKDENALYGGENQTKTTIGPIRWMAPEQLDAQMYSASSDVWSFAVILYEIFARQLPWKKYSNMRAAHLVLDKRNLAEERFRPKHINACVLVVMQSCFAYESSDRPTMSWCVKKLSNDWLLSSGGKKFVPRGKEAEVLPPPEPSEAGVYAAPPSRPDLQKNAPDQYTAPHRSPSSPVGGNELEPEADEAGYEAPPGR
jgi:serine/threonine protein kinase